MSQEGAPLDFEEVDAFVKELEARADAAIAADPEGADRLMQAALDPSLPERPALGRQPTRMETDSYLAYCSADDLLEEGKFEEAQRSLDLAVQLQTQSGIEVPPGYAILQTRIDAARTSN